MNSRDLVNLMDQIRLRTINRQTTAARVVDWLLWKQIDFGGWIEHGVHRLTGWSRYSR